MSQNRIFMLAAVLLLGLLFTAGCRPESSSTPPPTDSVAVDGGCVRISQLGDPEGLHPFNSVSGNANTIKEAIFMYLGNYNPQTLELEPSLVTSIQGVNADGLSYTYEMRPEARWDHGDPVTGEDFAFSVKCMLNPLADDPAMRDVYGFIEDVVIDAANPRKFTVVTNAPFFLAEPFITNIEVISHAFYDSLGVMRHYKVAQLSHPDAVTSADSALAAFSRKFNDVRYARDPAFVYGCGPYRLQSWTTGDNLTLVKKEDWWGNTLRGKSCFFTAYPQQLIFKTITDQSTLPAAAKNGEIDVVQSVSYEDFVAAQQDSTGYIAQNYQAVSPATYNYGYLGFNCKPGSGRIPLLSDLRVRQAFAHLVDIDQIIETFYEGLATPQWGPISPAKTNEYDPTLKRPAFDPQAAASLLDAAGWIDSDADGVRDQVVKGKRIPLKIEILVSSSSDTGVRIANMLADQAGKIGVVIEVNKLAGQLLGERLGEHDFDMALSAFGTNHLPTDLTQLWHSKSWAGGGTNYWGFGNAETDSLIAQIRLTPTAEGRRPLYKRFQELWVAQLPMVTMVCPNGRHWIHKRLRNAQATILRPGFKVIDMWAPVAEQQCK